MSTAAGSVTQGAARARSVPVPGFADKYRDFFPRVFAYVYARVGDTQVTEDLVADVFERAYRNMESLRSDDAFSTWLFTIARNVIISHGRKFGRETIVDPELMGDISPATASVETEVVLREELSDLSAIVRGFPQREQDILSLKFDAELPNAQIAEIMGLSEPNVRVIIFRTLRKLREIMAARRER